MDSHTPQKVLITGAGGFIGSHLVADQLGRGRRVIALDLHTERLHPLLSAAGLELLSGDVADEELQRRALEGVDTVFHLAAAHLSVKARAGEFARVNVEAVRRLVAASRRCGVRRFVHCSSVGVHGTIVHPPANEDSPCQPQIPYERTKLEGERLVLDAARRTGFPAVVIRPVWVYGPGCPRTEKLFRAIAKGRFVVAGAGGTLRHCVYIRDMLDAFDLAATKDLALSQVLIVGEAEAVTVRRLVDEIARLTGARPPRSAPSALLHAAGWAAELLWKPLGQEPPLSRRTLKFFTGNTAFDIGRARRLLGYEPRYDLRSGLRETHWILSGDRPPLPLPAPLGPEGHLA